jgi:hypothetical protein
MGWVRRVMPKQPSFYQVLTAAVADIAENGFDTAQRVQEWVRRIREAALRSLVPSYLLEEQLNAAFGATYRKLVERGTILERHQGVSRFQLAQVAPKLRTELDKRRMLSADLIKLNRAESVAKVERRFSGWASSVPPGGTDVADKVTVKTEIRKSLASLPFEERRVMIDQGHKFTAALDNIVSVNAGALALTWNSHWKQRNYDYREDHKERDGKVYVIRGNWAIEKGLMKADGHEYYDEITAVGEEVFCRCWASYIYSLRALPPGMVTDKGRAELQRVRMVV